MNRWWIVALGALVGCGSSALQGHEEVVNPTVDPPAEATPETSEQAPTRSAASDSHADESSLLELAASTLASPVAGPEGAPLEQVELRRHLAPILSKLRRSVARRQVRERRARGAMRSTAARAVATSPAQPTEDSVTNNQVAGVDEGGIVKAWGEYLLVLRRGRLFSVRLSTGTPTPVDVIDVRPRGSRRDVWYDEMLVHAPSGQVVVVGFSYDEGATELAHFSIASNGRFTRNGTHFLRSNDYYSSRNYASRLVGDRLVFYMPHYLIRRAWSRPRAFYPALRTGGAGWQPIVDSSEVYRVPGQSDASTLHTVVSCDLSAPRFSCTAQGILGGEGRTFYVSADAVYVWVHSALADWHYELDGLVPEAELERQEAAARARPNQLFRLPLDGGPPAVVEVEGAPIDQFSFHQTEQDLLVVLRARGSGDAMWSPEFTGGSLGLLRIPLSSFGPRVRAMARSAYRALPNPRGEAHVVQNRFVGDYLLYGSGASWGRRQVSNDDRVFLHHWPSGANHAARLGGGADRIEALGRHGMVVGTDGRDLHFQALELSVPPAVGGHYVRPGAAQGETRSHGFFYRARGGDEGTLGIPVRSARQPGYAHLVHGSAYVLYVDVSQLTLRELGVLAAQPQVVDDRCEVSCVDWYGNARPLFYRGRVFGLMGYELIEGTIQGGQIAEQNRTSLLSTLESERTL
ncbi:MAG: beta-propeller domain-containing protein [Myxococcota bacterium]